MSLIDNIAGLFGYNKPPTGQNKKPQQAPPKQPVNSGLSLIDQDIPPSKNSYDHLESYKKLSWIYKAVKKNADKTSEIDLRLMKRQDDGPIVEETHPALELLADVNDFMTFSGLISITQGYKELVGEAYWVLIRNGDGVPVEIWPLRPDKVTIQRNTGEFISGYEYKPDPSEKGVVFKAEDVIHHKDFDPVNIFQGVGAVQAISYAGDSDLYAQKWNRNFFYNSAVPLMAVLLKDNVGKNAQDRFEDKWKNSYRGVKNAHKVAVLKGVDEIITDLQKSHKDMDFLELRKFNRDEILSIFGVPKILLGQDEDVNRASAEVLERVWLKHEIQPKMRSLVDVLNEFFLRNFDETGEYYFDFISPVPEDKKLLLELHQAQGIPWMTPNEIRAERGLPELNSTEADKLYIPFNVRPIDVSTSDSSKEYNGVPFRSGLGKIPFKPKRYRRYKNIKSALEHHKDDFVNLIGGLLAGKKIFTPENKENIWKQFVNVSDSYESIIAEQLRKVFNQQKQEVLDNLREDLSNKSIDTVVKDVTDTPFVVSEWNITMKDLIRPIIIQLVKTQGQDAGELIGLGTFDTASDAVLTYLEREALEFVDLVNNNTVEKIREQLIEGNKEGEGIDELASRIENVFDSARENRAEMIARTETIRSSNFAREEAYRQSGNVTKKEWLTALDERTCPFCREMDGTIISVGKNYFDSGETMVVSTEDGEQSLDFNAYDITHPPLHPNCRCTTIPIVGED